MDYQVLGMTIRLHRLSAGLTQMELAEAADISAAFLGHIERGTRRFSVETLVRLCRALNVTPNDLLPDCPEEEPPVPHPLGPEQRQQALHLVRQAYILLKEAN